MFCAENGLLSDLEHQSISVMIIGSCSDFFHVTTEFCVFLITLTPVLS